ncbi:major facilitator superfamily domain-containing protein 6-like [Babylonia areolata]|uniref:major facilitator superfamily domain-containing protein 6-like n=1 Tax=Babylonia areolata TaxID=304850 RepID=UPI003FD086F1
MSTEYEPEDKPEQERRDSYDFQFTAKKLNSDHHEPTPTRKFHHPFNRDFIDSLFTVVNKELLFCKLFYFFFFGAFGSLFPLLAIYFKQLGMNASQGGVLIGFRPFIEFLSVPFWTGLADRWRRGKEMLLFALLCWVVFTLAIAFVKPPAHKCLVYNGTHTVLEIPYSTRRRRDVTSLHVLEEGPMGGGGGGVFSRQLPPEGLLMTLDGGDHMFLPLSDRPLTLQPKPVSRQKRAYHSNLDPSKIANANASDLSGLITSRFSNVVYRQDEVKSDFYLLLLIVVVGEFFSAPAITFADCVTLSLLGEDTENYGRQRMFGSLGWGLAMFFVGMALDQATTFPAHPCGVSHPAEKNYTVCFAVFSVLMSCAFLTALQFRYDFHGPGRDIALAELTEKVKDKVKKTITGRKKVDRERLIEEDDDEAYGAATGNYVDRGGVQDGGQKGQGGQVDGQTGGQADSQTQQELRIKPGLKNDMVTDALKAPGSAGSRLSSGPYHNQSGPAVPPGKYSAEPFFGKWMAVVRLLWSYQYLSVLFVAWFAGFGIGLIFTFLFWHLQDLGGSPTLFGVASIINHISELLAYFMSSKMLVAFGHVKVLYAGLAGNVARFLYISWLRDPYWVLPFEFMQGLTHAAVWAACCAYITHAIPGELKSSAQGILQALHHGLGRGCGAVFGGLLVYSYGSEITFRIYGIACILVLAVYAGTNYFLQDRGRFSHGSKMAHELMEDTAAHLAPHGVPSGLGRDLSASALTGEDLNTKQKDYGATSQDGNRSMSHDHPDPWAGADSYGSGYGDTQFGRENPFQQSFGQRETPQPHQKVYTGDSHLHHQQSNNFFDQGYGP